MEQYNEHIQGIRQALTEETAALDQMPRVAVLSNGRRTALHGDTAVYRFEVAENYTFAPSGTIRCTAGTLLRFSFTAVVAEVQSQFLYLLFPCNAGETVPELHCTWEPAEHIARLTALWAAWRPNTIVSSLLGRSFTGNELPAAKEPIFPSDFSPSQQQAVRHSMNRRISFVIGERKRGKTGVAASLVLNGLREGKRVLYLCGSSGTLHGLLKEIAAVNPVAAEESFTVLNEGLLLRSEYAPSYFPALTPLTDEQRTGIAKLFSIITAEHEYLRIRQLQERLAEKQRQMTDAAAELQQAKEELSRMQNASMLERMRTGKKALEELQDAVRDKNALVERLTQHHTALTKELYRKESAVPVPLREKKQFEQFAATGFRAPDTAAMHARMMARPCLATTCDNAAGLPVSVLQSFDIVCIDDAHALGLAQFFLFASYAGERCFILADVTEQSPRSAGQLDAARAWLQKNYFAYYQHEDSEYYRFMVNLLPYDTVSELVLPNEDANVFESALLAALEKTAVPAGRKGRIFLLNTEEARASSPQYIGKKRILPFNETNAKRVVECVKHALLNGTTTVSDILVTAPPSGQTLYLRESLKAHQLGEVEIAPLGALRLCSKRAVILDLTVAGIDFTLRSIDDRKSGLVHVADMLNTLFSTVTDDLYIVGDLSHFRSKYKGRLIADLLETIATVKENEAAVMSAARRFDDLTAEVRRRVIGSTAEEKASQDYRLKLEQTKPASALDARSAPTNTVAAADRKLKADIRAAGLRVIARREMINTISQYLGAMPLYKTTIETMKYASVLPEMDCENENDFKLVMDMWNLLIYETSDAQKVEHPLSQKARVDSKVPADLQQIHTFYHSDLEMIVEEGKNRLAQSIQKIFHDCIGRKPVTPIDWMNAYLSFLNRMTKYLDSIINQLRA